MAEWSTVISISLLALATVLGGVVVGFWIARAQEQSGAGQAGAGLEGLGSSAGAASEASGAFADELLAEKLGLYSRVLQENGRSLRRAVVSSNANTRDVLVAAGIEGFFEACIDGVVAQREGLKGKPAPDTFLAGARALGVAPAQAAVFEDALAGVAAGRAGGFAWVVGVDRVAQVAALRERGASIVVSDLSEQLEDR
jgi:HAD superfamily hydrolase (TIGR01509 family)